MKAQKIGMEISNEGFSQIPHAILNGLLLLDLTERQLKVCLLTIRLTYGCHKKWAKFIYADLITIGIRPPHAGSLVRKLISTGVLLHNGKTKEYKLNEEYLASEVTKKVTFYVDRLNKLIGKQLSSKTYQNSNAEVTESVTEDLPNWEPQTYQNSNTNPLPNREVSASNSTGLKSTKDILKDKEIKSDKDSTAGISFKQEEKVDPNHFSPRNSRDYAAQEAWKLIEPNNPDSFNFYLWASHKGLPEALFFQFASEIKDDHNILHKGKIFTTKVMDYLKGRGLVK